MPYNHWSICKLNIYLLLHYLIWESFHIVLQSHTKSLCFKFSLGGFGQMYAVKRSHLINAYWWLLSFFFSYCRIINISENIPCWFFVSNTKELKLILFLPSCFLPWWIMYKIQNFLVNLAWFSPNLFDIWFFLLETFKRNTLSEILVNLFLKNVSRQRFFVFIAVFSLLRFLRIRCCS